MAEQTRRVFFTESRTDHKTGIPFFGGQTRTLAPEIAGRMVDAGAAEYADLEDANATEGAKELAKERGVPLAGVEGSGSGGRVTKTDVEKKSGKEGA